jgi:uncharacterized RmlC-like cupin family protein/cold shock CspA family protein
MALILMTVTATSLPGVTEGVRWWQGGVVAGRTSGTVREWHDDLGWGVLDSPDTPGGCWAHYSVVEMEGFRSLTPGDAVAFDVEQARQDGYDFRAVRVLRTRPACSSTLSLTFDAAQPEPVRVIRPAELTGADPTAGMSRELAFESGLLWSGRVTTAPGAVSGWHHHDLNVSSLYVVQGVLRLEFEGAEGHLDAVAGDFVQVPAFTVHRESNPTDEPSVAVIARAGGGTPTVNVEEAPPPHGAR